MKRRPRLTRILGVLAISASLGCDRTTEPEPPVVDVYTPGNTFSPFSATIAVGGVVRFHIFGDEHNVIFEPNTPGAPANVNIVRDVVVERTFAAVGDFPYSCTVHPGMTGEIVVR